MSDEIEVSACQAFAETIGNLRDRGLSEFQIAQAMYHLASGLVLRVTDDCVQWQSAKFQMDQVVLADYERTQ